MSLKELIEGLEFEDLVGDAAGTEIKELGYDSRAVTSGSLFFCVPGHVVDGHKFATDAVGRGASAIVCERRLDLEVPQVIVRDARAAMAPMAARFFQEPTHSLLLAGVTGTNGKTTTAHLVRDIIEAGGMSCGLLGTVEQIVGGVSGQVEHTTPEAIDVQRLFRTMIESGDSACVMEVSSHALELNRCDLLEFEVGVFTNLSQDHLDFHGTMENYFAAKRTFFFPENGPAPKMSVVNADDSYGMQLIGELESSGREFVSYGVDSHDTGYRAVNIDPDSHGQRYDLVTGDGSSDTVETRLLGSFNIYNGLAALAAADCLGVARATSLVALAEADPVPGRLEPVDGGQEFKVLVDYAHTPDSLENVLKEVRAITREKVLTVFGCGGDRDRGKRPMMGEIACRLSDLVFVTSDNPRNEQPGKIIDEILVGAHRAKGFDEKNLIVEPDRRRAIAAAMKHARPGDTVVVAGKGHETGQEFEGGRKMEFDDRKIAAEEMRQLDAA